MDHATYERQHSKCDRPNRGREYAHLRILDGALCMAPSLSTEQHPSCVGRVVRFSPNESTSIFYQSPNKLFPFSSFPPFLEQTEIMVLSDDDGVTPPPSPTTTTPAPVLPPTATTTPAPVFAPVATPAPTAVVPTPEQLYSAKDVEDIGGTVTATAALYDPNLEADGGCDPAGCTAELTRVRRNRPRRRCTVWCSVGRNGILLLVLFALASSPCTHACCRGGGRDLPSGISAANANPGLDVVVRR